MDHSALQSMLAVPDMDRFKKVLCVQPHPDDNEIGMGATIAKLTDGGCRIDYLTITNGDLGNLGMEISPPELAAIRKSEAEASGKKLGATDFYWFSHPDGTLNDIPSLAGEIAELIRTNRYDAVFAPDPWLLNEAHYDHVVTGKAVAQAAINCSLKTYPRATETAAWQIEAVGFYFTSAPNTLPVVTPYFERKFEAMSLHKTQLPQQLIDLYRGFFEMQGKLLSGGDDICEGLKILAPLHLHCFNG